MSAKLGLLCLVALAAIVLSEAKPGKLDKVNVDDVLKNKRLLDNYIKCILDKGPCSAEGAELKVRLPKDLADNCSSCSDTERTRARKVITFLKNERPDTWKEFTAKYDPSGKWAVTFDKI